MKRTLFALTLFIPAAVLALDYSDTTSRYTDTPFSKAETAGISLLTTVGAVEGNPDGTFAPERTLNRAEFLKIALASVPMIRAGSSDAADCFPDVKINDWFSPYVCLAKLRGAVGGYPDGMFKPGNSVNYAEAIKILTGLYEQGCIGSAEATGCAGDQMVRNEPWYKPYVDWAAERDVLLPSGLPMDHLLTRGEMARLAAAYRAHHEDELTAYRNAERGIYTSSSSSSSVSSSVSSESSESSESSGSSESSESSVSTLYPARSRFLLLGSVTQPIASGTFRPRNADAAVRLVVVEMEREAKSIQELYLLGPGGEKLATLKLDVNDQTDKTWRFEIPEATGIRIPANVDTVFGISAKVKNRGTGSFSEELIQVRRFYVTLEESGQGAYQAFPTEQVFPKHQTAQSVITKVENALSVNGVLTQGTNVAVASFRILGEALPGMPLQVEHLVFTVHTTPGVVAERWHVGTDTMVDRHSCSVPSGSTNMVNCLSLPSAMGDLSDGSTILTLYADVTILPGTGGGTLQVTLDEAGDIQTFGALRWTDGAAHYRWVDVPEPVANGTLWTK